MTELGVSLIVFAAFIVCAMAVFQLLRVKRVMEALIGTFLAVYALSLVLISLFMRDVNFWTFSIFLVCFFVCFVQIFSVFYKSISLRLVWDVCANGGAQPLEDVYAESIVSGSFLRRIAALEEGGLISRDRDTVALTAKGSVTARRIVAVQQLLGIEQSG